MHARVELSFCSRSLFPLAFVFSVSSLFPAFFACSTYINYINFDVELLRPGCAGIPTFNYVRRDMRAQLSRRHCLHLLALPFAHPCLTVCLSRVSPLLSVVFSLFQVQKFRVTILLMLIAACMFFVACVVRLWRRVAKKRRLELQVAESRAPPPVALVSGTPLPLLTRFQLFRRTEECTDAVERMQHALLILLSIFYLRLCILQFKAFVCITAPDPLASTASNAAQTQSLYLAEDMQTRCYQGAHAVTVAFVVLLLLFYTAGFPLFCFALLMRSFANKRTPGVLGWLWAHCSLLRGTDRQGSGEVAAASGGVSVGVSELSPAALIRSLVRSRENRYGYLFFSYRPSHFATCMLVFVVQVCVAAITVFVADDSPLLKLFLFGMLWGGQTLLFAIQLPFEQWAVNVRKVLFGLLSLVTTKNNTTTKRNRQ